MQDEDRAYNTEWWHQWDFCRAGDQEPSWQMKGWPQTVLLA